jgi:hypothetical protein
MAAAAFVVVVTMARCGCGRAHGEPRLESCVTSGDHSPGYAISIVRENPPYPEARSSIFARVLCSCTRATLTAAVAHPPDGLAPDLVASMFGAGVGARGMLGTCARLRVLLRYALPRSPSARA